MGLIEEPQEINSQNILNSLDSSIILIDNDSRIVYLNSSAEQFFGGSQAQLIGKNIDQLLPNDSVIMMLIKQVQVTGTGISDYGLQFDTPRTSKHLVNLQISPLSDKPGHTIITLFERSIADKIDRQLTHRNAARSVSAISAMLAHEVKNPLSGIRGAAQLLEAEVDPGDKKLTRLICDETDRICALVDRMEVFSDQRPIERHSVNAHKVLGRVRQIAENGFAKDLNFIEKYDPSLPDISGDYDILVQIFLNLVKNSAEAIEEIRGEIILETSYQHSVSLSVPGSSTKMHLPLVISIYDNGAGIPKNMQDNLFEAFVTSKSKGSGLGLALVAKMVDDHGGVIEFDSFPGKTVFRVMLPMFNDVMKKQEKG